MPISCQYCDKTHETAREVRACWEEHGRPGSSNRRAGRSSPPRRAQPSKTSTAQSRRRWIRDQRRRARGTQFPTPGGQGPAPNSEEKPKKRRGAKTYRDRVSRSPSPKPKQARPPKPRQASPPKPKPRAGIPTRRRIEPHLGSKQVCFSCGGAISIEGKCGCS